MITGVPELFFFVIGVISTYKFLQWLWTLIHCDCTDSITEFPFEGWFLFTPVLARLTEEPSSNVEARNYVFKPKHHLDFLMWFAVGLSNAWNITARLWDKNYDAVFPVLLRLRKAKS